ncbi:MAG: hypothetical protein NTX15_03855 [Candidatus Kapabacteria bacterium]|nr:hypothetical protein [Candidatus Kapabacteria bacterium]
MAYSLVLIGLAIVSSVVAVSQPVWSGFRSQATAVVAVDSCKRTLTVLDPSLLRRGDHVLLHQTISRDSTKTGMCEYSIVDTTIGTTVFLQTAGVHLYDPSFGLQVVKLLYATGASINDTLRCLPWNGMHGGIIAIECRDTLYINGVIDASGSGGRGGRASLNTFDTATIDDTNTMSLRSVTMGEGLGSAYGGLARNAGGGGGSLFGSGGNGGDQTSAFTRLVRGGRSAWAPGLLLGNDRILIGSGGGGGHQNDFNGTQGGAGGGIIIVRAPVVVSTSNKALLLCRGGHALGAREDGAGGGGSGGTIAVFADTIIGVLEADVSGGNGGNTWGELFHYGPGGGGGGGIVGCSSASIMTTSSVITVGGRSGTSICNSNHEETSYGAREGIDGVRGVLTPIVKGATRRERVTLSARDTVVSDGARTILIATGGVSYLWRERMYDSSQNNDTVETAEITTPRWFVVEITTEGGCVVTDSVYVRPAIMSVSIDDARGAPGDTVDLYLRVKSEPSNARTIIGVAWVSMRATTLLPLRNAVRLNDTTVQMTFPFRLASRAGTTFRRSNARAVLGDSASVTLKIDSVQLDTSVSDLRILNGVFSLDGLCVESGRPRLLAPLEIPFAINGRTVTSDATEVLLTDLLGKRVILETVRTGSQISATIPDVAIGTFYLTLVKDGRRKTVGIVIE